LRQHYISAIIHYFLQKNLFQFAGFTQHNARAINQFYGSMMHLLTLSG